MLFFLTDNFKLLFTYYELILSKFEQVVMYNVYELNLNSLLMNILSGVQVHFQASNGDFLNTDLNHPKNLNFKKLPRDFQNLL